MRKVLIWLSGANREVLDLAPSDRPKYEGIGGVVLTTAVMAAISCAFALSFALQAPLAVSVVAGLLWGLAIMNLDRWLISATPRRDTWWKNLVQTFPRLIVALLIGTVVSTPLVMRIFQPEIDSQLEVIQQRDRDAFAEQSAANDKKVAQLGEKAKYYEEARVATGDSAVVKSQPSVKAAAVLVDKARQKRDTALEEYNQNPSAANLSTLNNAKGTLAGRERSYSAARDSAVKDVRAEGAANYERAKKAYDDAKARAATSNSEFSEANEERTGLLARLEALREVTAKNGTLQRAYIILLLFITMIEILPVLVKFMMTLGEPNSYERALDRFEATKLREADMALRDRESAAETKFARAAKDREERARAQEEIDAARREEWREKELNSGTGRRRKSNTSYSRM